MPRVRRMLMMLKVRVRTKVMMVKVRIAWSGSGIGILLAASFLRPPFLLLLSRHTWIWSSSSIMGVVVWSLSLSSIGPGWTLTVWAYVFKLGGYLIKIKEQRTGRNLCVRTSVSESQMSAFNLAHKRLCNAAEHIFTLSQAKPLPSHTHTQYQYHTPGGKTERRKVERQKDKK